MPRPQHATAAFLPSAHKPLDQMNRLADMAHFPPLVNAGATANILLTITLTYVLVPRIPQLAPGLPAPTAPLLWTALVLVLNLAPVIVLRATARPGEPMRTLGRMNFVRDQHRFSDWVYLAASANMAFWILTAWALFSIAHTPAALAPMLAIAFLVTFSPVLLRTLRRQ